MQQLFFPFTDYSLQVNCLINQSDILFFEGKDVIVHLAVKEGNLLHFLLQGLKLFFSRLLQNNSFHLITFALLQLSLQGIDSLAKSHIFVSLQQIFVREVSLLLRFFLKVGLNLHFLCL